MYGGTHLVGEPFEALGPKLLLEEIGAQLACQEGDVVNDGQAYTPVLVLCQLLNCRQQALSQQLDADHLVDLQNQPTH